MRRLKFFAVLAFLSVTSASTVAAQACLGMASFAAAPVQLSGSANFYDGGQVLGGSVATGSRVGAFGSLSIGAISYDALDASALSVGGTGGYQVPLGPATGAQICPVIGMGFGVGPNDIGRTEVDMSSWGATFGFRLGAPVRVTPLMQVVPTGGFSLAYQSVKLEDSFDSISDSETYGQVDLGLGLVMHSVFTIRPGTTIPVGLDESSPSFNMTVGVNIGTRR